ncbi:hypothetical protein, partial [endosymbiont of Ridgeia piscesae]
SHHFLIAFISSAMLNAGKGTDNLIRENESVAIQSVLPTRSRKMIEPSSTDTLLQAIVDSEYIINPDRKE